MNPAAARLAVPLVPFLCSALLSLATVGDRVFWQDSGFYLAAIREFIPLYPPGFVLHLVLAKAWTFLLEPLAGFTRSVHLFSSLCAALAASVTACAARDFLTRVLPDRPRYLPAAGAGCLVASGYSFAHAAILSKSYALFNLCVALLLWLMVRAERKRDFALLGLLLGLSWSAHPLGAFLIPACVAYAVVRRDRIQEWGWPWFTGVAGCAAFGAWGPSILLLPWLGARQSLAGFGDPRAPGELLRYLLGSRFLEQEGSFLLIAGKWRQAAEYVWEEYLGVGMLLLGLGAWELRGAWRRIGPVAATWILPIAGFTLVYVHEAYPDLWMVALFIPLGMLLAAGLARLAARSPGLAGAALAVGLGWAAGVNLPDLDQRGYRHAETYARLLLRPVEPGAPVLLSTDDGISTIHWLRNVQGEFRDRRVISTIFLYEDWYRKLVTERLGLPVPPERTYPGVADTEAPYLTFCNAYAGPGRPVYCERLPDPRYLDPRLEALPHGLLWRVAPKGESVPDADWDAEVDLDALSKARRRLRAHRISGSRDGTWAWHRETYEDRLLTPILLARLRRVDPVLPSKPGEALEAYRRAADLAPPLLEDPRFRFNHSLALYLTDRLAEARTGFERLLEAGPGAELATMGRYYLGEIALAGRRPEEARRHFEAAIRSGGVAPEVMEHIRRRASGR